MLVNRTMNCQISFLNDSLIICAVGGGHGNNLTIFVNINGLSTTADKFSFYTGKYNNGNFNFEKSINLIF